MGDGGAASRHPARSGQTRPGPPRYPPETSACPPLPTGLRVRDLVSWRPSGEQPRRARTPRGTVHTGDPRPPARPGPGARADLDSLVRTAARALGPREGSRAHPRCSLPPKPGGAGKRAGGRSLRPRPNPAPRAPGRCGGEHCAWRRWLTRLEPEAQTGPPKCREMYGEGSRET